MGRPLPGCLLPAAARLIVVAFLTHPLDLLAGCLEMFLQRLLATERVRTRRGPHPHAVLSDSRQAHQVVMQQQADGLRH